MATAWPARDGNVYRPRSSPATGQGLYRILPPPHCVNESLPEGHRRKEALTEYLDKHGKVKL